MEVGRRWTRFGLAVSSVTSAHAACAALNASWLANSTGFLPRTRVVDPWWVVGALDPSSQLIPALAPGYDAVTI